MKKNVAILSFFLFLFSTLTWSQAAAAASYSGTVERIKVHGKLLEGNLDGDSPDRDVSIYLPASYAKEKSRRYPVVYFLHGFTDSEEKWFRAPDHWINLPKVLNKAFGEPGSREMIVVMPNAFTRYEGSFYGTSVDTGDWDGFVSQELVAYIDSHYRTIARAASRGLAGHSMGGYGTIRIGMKHPEVFSSIYAMSACCLDNSALQMNDGMKGAEAVSSPEQIHEAPFWAKAMLATAAAWSPDPNNAPLYIDLPFKDGKLQPLIAAKWAANSPVSMLDQYIPNVKRLKALAMDIGDQDGLAPGVKLLDQALNEYKIPHFYEVYPGDHLNHIGDRIETKVVPFFSENLEFGAAKPTKAPTKASSSPGTVPPADARFTAKLVAPHVWRIDDKGSDNMYLVEGKKKALLIDTGLGLGDLHAYVETLTKLPVTVVNTHGHPDHAGSNFQFNDVYAHPADSELLQRFDNRAKRAASLKPVTYHEVKEGYSFDLGGRRLEVIEVPGHTPGSIVLLDAANKLLFTGDNDNTLVWLFLKDSLPLEVYLATLEKLNHRAGEFETMLPGHGDPLDKAFVSDQIAATKSILDGSCVAKPYKSFAGDALVCEQKRASVAYDPEKLRQNK